MRQSRGQAHPAPGGKKSVRRSSELADRFFKATALAGELHLTDFNYWDEWDPAKVTYRDEAEASWLKRMGGNEHRVIRTTVELEAALGDSVSARGLQLYIADGLLDEARRLWERMKQGRKRR